MVLGHADSDARYLHLCFSYVFKARWAVQTNDGTILNFALMLFSGLLIHGMIADILVRSPRLVLDNANFVKKVVFPLETLSWIVLLSTLFNFVIGFILLLGFVVIAVKHSTAFQ
jgi:lipopolysaccharide transport system permease protein